MVVEFQESGILLGFGENLCTFAQRPQSFGTSITLPCSTPVSLRSISYGQLSSGAKVKTSDEVITRQSFSGPVGHQRSDGRKHEIRLVLTPKLLLQHSNFRPSFLWTTLDTTTQPLALRRGVKWVRQEVIVFKTTAALLPVIMWYMDSAALFYR